MGLAVLLLMKQIECALFGLDCCHYDSPLQQFVGPGSPDGFSFTPPSYGLLSRSMLVEGD